MHQINSCASKWATERLFGFRANGYFDMGCTICDQRSYGITGFFCEHDIGISRCADLAHNTEARFHVISALPGIVQHYADILIRIKKRYVSFPGCRPDIFDDRPEPPCVDRHLLLLGHPQVDQYKWPLNCRIQLICIVKYGCLSGHNSSLAGHYERLPPINISLQSSYADEKRGEENFNYIVKPEMPKRFRGLPMALGWFIGLILMGLWVAHLAYDRDSPMLSCLVIGLLLAAVGGWYVILVWQNFTENASASLRDATLSCYVYATPKMHEQVV